MIGTRVAQEIEEERRLKRTGAEREENERHAMAINAQVHGMPMRVCLPCAVHNASPLVRT